jgi:hypothetical protein
LVEQWVETLRSYTKEESLVQDALPDLTNALTLLLSYRHIWKSEESRAFDQDAMNIFYSAYRANVNALKICYECERKDFNRYLKTLVDNHSQMFEIATENLTKHPKHAFDAI